MEEKISIIVPIYKVEKYLSKCIDSIVCQTYSNLEIILVDDGSPDACGKICDHYAKRDKRIHVIHKKNEGVACARNEGIKYASGNYISFIDSDDWIAEDAYEKLYRGLMEYDADCAVGGCVTVIDKEGTLIPQKTQILPVEYRSATEAMKHVLLSGSAVWNRLFKRNIFQDIRFPCGRVNDDEVAVLHAYAKCNNIVFLNQDTYYYRIRKDSITTSRFSIRNMDCYYNSIDNLAFIKQEMPELTEPAEYKFIKAMLYCYVNLRKMKQNSDIREIQKELHRSIKQNVSVAYVNRYMSLPMKLLMFVCAVL